MSVDFEKLGLSEPGEITPDAEGLHKFSAALYLDAAWEDGKCVKVLGERLTFSLIDGDVYEAISESFKRFPGVDVVTLLGAAEPVETIYSRYGSGLRAEAGELGGVLEWIEHSGLRLEPIGAGEQFNEAMIEEACVTAYENFGHLDAIRRGIDRYARRQGFEPP